MAKNKFKEVYSIDNLTLAWKRINTSTNNLNYKAYYREIYFDYECNLQKNLKRLSDRIKKEIYVPCKCARIYKPKHTGLLRPITLLDVEDQIVYMACANVLLPEFSERRAALEYKTVFSNILNDNIETNIFVLKKWKEGYFAFQKNIKKNFDNGLLFTAHFDLASFFDTIDHDCLTSPFTRDSKFQKSKFGILLNSLLLEWSNSEEAASKKISHSIPQGPLASAIFAELFLLSIDEKLVQHGIIYSRYVDDIVIQGKTRNEVLQGIVILETLCKEKGLIPQSSKFSVFEADSVESAIGKSPSLTTEIKKAIFSDEKELLKKFKESLDKDTYNSSFLRYTLKTYSESSCLVDVILENFENNYELVEEFIIYLSKFIADNDIQIKCRQKLGPLLYRTNNPYDFVQCQIWILLAKINQYYLLPSNYTDLAIKLLNNRKTSFSLKYGVFTYLATIDNNAFSKYLINEGNLLTQLQIKNITNNICEKLSFSELVEKVSKSKLVSLSSILANHLCTLLFLGQITMPEYLKYAKILNCEKRKHIEPIEYFMLEDYKINTSFDWKKLFAKDYDLANQIILEMHNAIKINKTMWLNLADAFNDLLIKTVVSLLEVIHPAEKFPTIINKKGELLDFGVVLGNFDPSKCTNFLSPIHFNFKAIHDRRCSSPLSHPKDLKTLKSADFVNKREFPKFLNYFSCGCSQLLKLISPYI